MKATGIVRRIDDPLEIYTAADGEVIFKKYSPIGELSETAYQYAEVLNRATELPVLITDRDHVIAVSGASKRDLMERRVTEELEALMQDRVNYAASPDIPPLYPIAGYEKEAALAFPIIVAASFLGKQMEE